MEKMIRLLRHLLSNVWNILIKYKRLNKKNKNIDRISYLPDPLRSHIVSFLPFEDAIRTSILSQQWRHVCSSLSNLDFRQIEYIKYKYDGREGRQRFKSIIDQTLILHDGSDIQKFYFKIRPAEDDPIPISLLQINTWISFALRHNVKNLGLDIVGFGEDLGQLQLPCALFTCPTLVSLTVYVVDLKFPSVIRFPVLKKLMLYEIIFPNEYLTDKLFSDCCCPILNVLLIKHCSLQNLTKLNITLSSLKRFKLSEYVTQSCKINLSAPNLQKFGYNGTTPPNVSFKTVSSLVCATFECDEEPSDLEIVNNCAGKILIELPKLETLVLLDYFIQFFNWDQSLLSSLPTQCASVKNLQLGMDASIDQGLSVAFLLRSCPNIQKLCIVYHWDKTIPLEIPCMEKYWKSNEFFAGFLLKHLRTVSIVFFQGSESEVDILRFLLQSASNLEKMDIFMFDLEEDQNLEAQMRICQDLLNIPKVSSQAKVQIFSRDRVAYASNF